MKLLVQKSLPDSVTVFREGNLPYARTLTPDTAALLREAFERATLASLALQVHIGNPDMTLIRSSEKQRDNVALNWRVRWTIGSCGMACTLALPTRRNQLTAQVTARYHSQTS